MRQQMMMKTPHRHDDASLVRHGGQGMYWQARDGMVVRLAAPEVRVHDVPLEQRALEACAPEGGVVYAAARGPAQAVTRGQPRVGAAGLAMALWMRLFADTA
jgi:hypothetical protein